MKYLFFFFLIVQTVSSQSKLNPEDTEVWHPEPKVVTPGKSSAPPSDAIILFDGTDFLKWQHGNTKKPVQWTLNKDKSMTVKPGKGGIETIEEHGSIQFHIEWKTPTLIKGKGQGRGNSGIFFQRRYEVQVLDSYNNRTYSNGQASSIYKQHIPLVNSTRKPGERQVYDIIFNEPKSNAEGQKIKSGSFTILLNGVLVQNNVEILGTTEYIGVPKNGRDDMPGDRGSDYESPEYSRRPLTLQDHGDLVSY